MASRGAEGGDLRVAGLNLLARPARWRLAGRKVMEILVVLAVLAAWIALQLWILPRFGVST